MNVIKEKEMYEQLMSKYEIMSNKKLKTIINILDHTEGLCMPEFVEFCNYLLSLDNNKGEENVKTKKCQSKRQATTKSSQRYIKRDIS